MPILTDGSPQLDQKMKKTLLLKFRLFSTPMKNTKNINFSKVFAVKARETQKVLEKISSQKNEICEYEIISGECTIRGNRAFKNHK